jgi:hypothetical protein
MDCIQTDSVSKKIHLLDGYKHGILMPVEKEHGDSIADDAHPYDQFVRLVTNRITMRRLYT